ncbi:MAG: NfeD family protein [Pyrinomonadaceae bacterium]|nr:NfeD family protein [Pyrinomonadaceae bacterium]MCX7639717.1 NfeD family protein [Pyrinomonadaceae bacterium]MDW8304300.1 NfeD family protein [Acidobacteriota bacterium]
MEYVWIIWVIIGIILMLAEIFTFGFVLFWFGIGALLAGLVSYFGFGYIAQFAVFLIVSAALTIFSRHIFSGFLLSKESKQLRIGVEGKVGVVTESSKGALNEGAVKVYGSVWTAFPEEGEEPLKEGEKVVVTRVEGASIYVKKLESKNLGLPDWRKEN